MTGENRIPNHEALVEQFGSHAAQFRDGLEAGVPLDTLENFCTWTGTKGIDRVTVSDLDRLRDDETYGELAKLVLECTLDRVRRVF